MRVLVTGGAGFIGSHIIELLLEEGHEPAALDDLSSSKQKNVPKEVKLYEADIRNLEAVRRAFQDFQPEAVSHQAAQVSVSRSVREVALDADINILGLINVLSCCQEFGTGRFSFASSGGAIYGDVFEPATEQSPLQPFSPYGISKMVGEAYMQFYTTQFDFTAVALRYSNVYGPRQDPHGEAGVVAIFSKLMNAENAVTIFGDGSCVRDYVYVGDVARANFAALTSDLPSGLHAFNIGTATGTDVNELTSTIRDASLEVARSEGRELNIPDPIHGPPRSGDLQSSLISPAKAKQVLGWVPGRTLKDGLTETVEWFLKNS
ncbi:NAD-dependent epimerase/dehydratase family protein [Calycomorphotria hydatis]|uniref:UDP-glucose 4-epimerase n=1 Tax=Calycomorphotria hydatis TaxID=2528027 RepID=A0A517T8S7_9PLAN|nr:NAD-dependent epimerase/dehydratase family protein [Calycomorphotria hydatis]QDT64784.1 UDP-glucose 4-epimerase [Calycomorphotria hydatis]